MESLEVFTRLFFTKDGLDMSFVEENIPLLKGELPFGACLFFNLCFGNIFFKIYQFEGTYYGFTNLGFIPREVFASYSKIEGWIKDVCESNFSEILEATGYDVNHRPVNNYPEEDCPYCKAVYPKDCAKHAAIRSWEHSTRCTGRYSLAIMDISLNTNYTWNLDEKVSEVYIRPTGKIDLSIQRKDGVLSLYRYGKWFSYYR